MACNLVPLGIKLKARGIREDLHRSAGNMADHP